MNSCYAILRSAKEEVEERFCLAFGIKRDHFSERAALTLTPLGLRFLCLPRKCHDAALQFWLLCTPFRYRRSLNAGETLELNLAETIYFQ